jgi:integrase/recombinase XerD
MSTVTVSPLRQRMIEDMNARKLCAGTQRIHIGSCKQFAAYLKRSPDTATAEDIRRFQLHLAETGMSICNRNRIMTGVKFLFRVTLRRLDLAAEIYHLREPQKIPLVMSQDETRRLLAVAGSLKVRVLLSLGYGCGLRAGEVVRLKVKHIDSAQKIIRVEQSKSRKDRRNCRATSSSLPASVPRQKQPEVARTLLNLLTSPAAIELFTSQGFEPAPR